MLADRCQQCHSAEPKFGAPMPLVTRADLLATTLDGQDTVADRSVTRMSADDKRMPQPPNAAATTAEIAMMQTWIDAGSPARGATEMCGGTGGGGAGGAVNCEPDLSLVGQQPYEMPATSSDEQVCIGVSLTPSDTKRHITAILPRIDNSTIIHHMLLLQSPTAVSPTPSTCGFTQAEWKLLYAWGPGTPPHVLPQAAGFPLNANEEVHFVIQIHYNNLQGLVGETDLSGMDLCTTTNLRANDADIMAFGGTGFSGIAPMATSQLDCNSSIPALVDAYFPITIFQSWPHMHQLGKALRSTVETGANSQVLADVTDYDFDYQLTYPNDQIVVDVGDSVRTTCTWENTTGSSVGFGEDTGDEMCFNFVAYYPRVEAPLWSWLAPAQAATCNMTTQ